MKIKSWVLGIIVLVCIFGGIGASSALGYWQTESNKIPAKYQSGEFAGEYDPSDIRGSYSFGEISELFDIPLNDLGTAFVPEPVSNLSAFLCKDLESLYANAESNIKIGTDSVRLFVSLYTGLPYALSSGTYLPESAIAILQKRANLTEEQIAFLHNQSEALSNAAQQPTTSTSSGSVSAESHDSTGRVTGKTTFQELLDWGVSRAGIEEVIGDELPATGTAVRDYAAQKGIEFSGWKNALQAKVEAASD
jgi:hypothetical protein